MLPAAGAALRCAPGGASRAGKVGKARNLGVTGVAFFLGKGDTIPDSEVKTRETASPFPADPRFAQPPRR